MAEIREAGRSGTRTNWTFSFARMIGETGVYVSYILNENYACEPEEPNQAGTFIEQLTSRWSATKCAWRENTTFDNGKRLCRF